MILQGSLTHNQQQRVLLVILFAMVLWCSATSARPHEMNNTLRKGRYDPTVHGGNQGKYVPDESGKYHHMVMPYDGGYGDTGLGYAHDNRSIYHRPAGPFALGPNDHLHFMIDFNYNGSGWQIIQFEWKRDGQETQLFKYMEQHPLWSGVAVLPSIVPIKSTDATQSTVELPAENEAIFMEPTVIEPAAEDVVTETEGESDVATDVSITERYGCDSTTECEGEMVAEVSVESSDVSSKIHVDGDYDPFGKQNKIYNLKYSQNDGENKIDRDQLRDAINEILNYIQTQVVPSLS